MNLKHGLLAATVASVPGPALVPALAGSPDGASVACYVATYACDQLGTDFCAALWTPGAADVQTIAHFEVVGLPSGSFSFTWNLPCGTSHSCDASIGARRDQTILGQVTVYDTATGLQRTRSADADHIHGWD